MCLAVWSEQLFVNFTYFGQALLSFFSLFSWSHFSSSFGCGHFLPIFVCFAFLFLVYPVSSHAMLPRGFLGHSLPLSVLAITPPGLWPQPQFVWCGPWQLHCIVGV